MRVCFRRHCVCGTPVLQLSPSDNPGRSQGSGGKCHLREGLLRLSTTVAAIASAHWAEVNTHTPQFRPSPVDEGSAVCQPSRKKRRRGAAPQHRTGRGVPPLLPGPGGHDRRPPRCPRGSLSRPEQELFPGPFPAGRQRCLCGLALPARSRFAYMNVKSNYVGSFA